MRRVTAAVGAACAACAGIVSMRWLTRSKEDTRWQDVHYPGKRMQVDGVSLHYIEAGSGPAFVMVHGFGGSSYSFRYQMDAFAKDHRCIAIDLKGFGYSERVKGGDYSLTEQARLVLKALDQLGIRDFVLMGHSMGGDVSMRIASMAPERVEKLILAASAPGMKLLIMPRLPIFKPLMNFWIRATLPRYTKRLFFDRTSVDEKKIIEGYRKTARIKGSRNTVWEMWASLPKDKPIQYKKIRMLTLILWAEKDRILPFPGLALWWLKRKLPHREVVTISRTGHLLLEERPVAADAAISRFLAGDSEAQIREAALAVA
ncbi:MAG: alpha/beta hydrolase [Chloroflexota bacterium]